MKGISNCFQNSFDKSIFITIKDKDLLPSRELVVDILPLEVVYRLGVEGMPTGRLTKAEWPSGTRDLR